jgi:hypothetical protein
LGFCLPAGKFYNSETKYSQPNSGQKEFAGWSREGLQRFQKMGEAVLRIRKRSSTVMYERHILKKLRFEHKKETEQKKKKRKVSLLFAPKLQPVLTTAGWDDHLDADDDDDDHCHEEEEEEDEMIIMDDDTSSNNSSNNSNNDENDENGGDGDGSDGDDNHHTGNDNADAN